MLSKCSSFLPKSCVVSPEICLDVFNNVTSRATFLSGVAINPLAISLLKAAEVLSAKERFRSFSLSQLDNYSIRENIALKVNISIPNLRLFVGNIPKSKSKDEIQEEFANRTGNKRLPSKTKPSVL